MAETSAADDTVTTADPPRHQAHPDAQAAERWQRVKQLFAQALARPVEERRSFLDQACDGDPTLHAEVMALIAADYRSLPWLDDDVLAAQPALWAPPEARLGTRIGPYVVERELGRGGMGAVYLGVRGDDQFQQHVAIKLIKRGMDSDEIVDRFRRERQILASLTHPNITRLLDGGRTEDGLPYFVMERIEGEPIDRHCVRAGLSIDQRLDLVRQVCEAVHHAHGCLVVHRDLKPANVLVTAASVPKLLDFGIAKLLGAEHVPFHTAVTAANGVPLTADYASPEQIRGAPITTASDIYSLGVLLYELLSGSLPFSLAGRSPQAIEQLICETDPVPPSSVADETLNPRQQRVRHRQLAGDLDNIVAKALNKEPKRRYASAAQLAEDLRRHQTGLPVIARPDSLVYQSGKLIQRHRVGALAAALVVLSLVVGMATTSWQARKARSERQHAREQAIAAEQVADFLAGVLQETDPFARMGEDMSVPALLDRAAERIERDLEAQPRVRARVLATIGVALGRNDHFDQARTLLEQSIAIRRRELGDDAPETAASLTQLGALLRLMGELEPAEQNLRHALAIQQAHFGENSVEAIDTLGDLASVLRDRGALAEAEPLARQALAVSRVGFAPGSLEVAERVNDLALLLGQTEKLAEAETLHREALAAYRAQHGTNHLTVAVSLHNLADLLRRRGQTESAIEAVRESLSIYRRVAGDDSTHVANGLNTLGVLLKRTQQYDAAETAYREALSLQRRLLGPDHPAATRTAANLGMMLMDRGDHASAEDLIAGALASTRRKVGDHHPSLVARLHQLGTLRLRQGESDAAERTYQEALAIARAVAHPDRQMIALLQLGYGRALLAQEQPRAAEQHLRQAMAFGQAAFEPGHVWTAQAQSWLGASLIAQERFAEAEPLLVEGHRALVVGRGEDHATTLAAAERIETLRRIGKRQGGGG